MDEDRGGLPAALDDLEAALDRLNEDLEGDGDVAAVDDRLRLVDEVAIPTMGALLRLQAETLHATRAAVRDELEPDAAAGSTAAGPDDSQESAESGDGDSKDHDPREGDPEDPDSENPNSDLEDPRSPAQRVEDAIGELRRALDDPQDDPETPDADVVSEASDLRGELEREVADAAGRIRESTERQSADDDLDAELAGSDVDVESELETLKRQREAASDDPPEWANRDDPDDDADSDSDEDT